VRRSSRQFPTDISYSAYRKSSAGFHGGFDDFQHGFKGLGGFGLFRDVKTIDINSFKYQENMPISRIVSLDKPLTGSVTQQLKPDAAFLACKVN